MKNKLLFSGLALFSLTAAAQQLHDGDILWPNSQKLPQFVENWTPGQPLKVTKASETSANPASSDGEEFYDENFFISRVKLKPHFRHTATQVNGTFDTTNDKKLLNWVPVNKANDGHTDALPNGLFDSEVFSNWSYVTHWGDWISPHGWVPGAFADAAHKHGTLVSGVASIPNAALSGDWRTCLETMAGFDDAKKEKLAKFLYYHGVNGLGYNSEFTGASSTLLANLQTVHKYVINWIKENKKEEFENVWYNATQDNGGIVWDPGLTDANKNNFSGCDFFLNYNWNTNSILQKSVAKARELGRDPFDLYAGHNMQGGEPHAKSGSGNWAHLAQYPVSIGLWGAHNTNLLWAGRSANGSNPRTMQDTYQKRNEEWFTNAHRNPVNVMTPYNREKFSPDQNWFGMSVYMSARSSLSWDLTEEPFITFFNLGNGTFLNWEGERKNNNEWYNIGVQDYMPTWRWWFTKTFLGKQKSDLVENGLDAQFIWDDAWMGGSCLNVIGTSEKEYLHLYKTKFEIKPNDEITVRYKLIGGKANAKLVFSIEGEETDPIEYDLFDTTQEVDDEWIEFTLPVNNRTEIANNTIAVIALGFENAENLNLRLGELSIKRTSVDTPTVPEIKHTKILRNNYYGVDAKIVFNMKNEKEANGEPCYNTDVNTSLFKLWAEVDGKEQLMGITSSWAGLMFSIPAGDAKSIRLGVSAVSLDFETESQIAWSGDLELLDRETSEEIVLSQGIIKPNEPFTVGYLDQKHAPAKWEITNAYTDAPVITLESATIVEFEKGLEEIAPYNVKVTEQGGNVREFAWMIQITGEKAGAMPKIDKVYIDGEEEAVTIEPGETIEVSYTGRAADGSSTRAISAEEKWIGGNMGTTGLNLEGPFTVCAWVKYTYAASNGSSCFFSVEDRTVGWPQNNWGWFWSNLNEDGTIGSFTHRTSYTGGSAEMAYKFPDTKIPLGVWTHVAIVFDKQGTNQRRTMLYVNGILQEGTWYNNKGSGAAKPTTEFWTNPTTSNPLNNPEAAQWFSFFGGRGEGYVTGNGMVDDLQLWSKALSAEEVQKAMNMTRDQVTDDLQCYWDFETDDEINVETGAFKSVGKSKTAEASNYALFAAEAEGQAAPTPQPAVYTAGNPFVEGQGYIIKTEPTWTGRRAIVEDAEGTGEAGSAKVTYTKEGDYTLTLTLANDYGQDVREYPLVTVEEDQGTVDPDPEDPDPVDPEDPDPVDPEDPDPVDPEDPDGVQAILADGSVRTYTVDDTLYVAFAADGDYEIAVYNVAGDLVAQKAATVAAGNTMRITLANPAVYVVRVTKAGKAVKGFKVVRK